MVAFILILIHKTYISQTLPSHQTISYYKKLLPLNFIYTITNAPPDEESMDSPQRSIKLQS